MMKQQTTSSIAQESREQSSLSGLISGKGKRHARRLMKPTPTTKSSKVKRTR
jgi:hypothetical protein